MTNCGAAAKTGIPLSRILSRTSRSRPGARFFGALGAVWAFATAVGCPSPVVDQQAAWPLFSLDATSPDNPLPDGRLLGANGGLDLLARERFYFSLLPAGAATHEAEDLFVKWSEQIGERRGWGASASAFVRFSAPLDAASLEGALITFVTLVDEGERFERVVARPFWHEELGVLELEPSLPLPEAAQVALVIGPGLTTQAGEAVGPSPDFTSYAQGEGRAAVERAAASLALLPEQVALVTVFPTDDATSELEAAVDRVRTYLPRLDLDPEPGRIRGNFPRSELGAVFGSQADGALAPAGRVVIGALTSLDLRSGNRLDEDKVSGLAEAEEVRLEVVIVYPDPERYPGPRPAALVQHGFGSDNRFVINRGTDFVDAGYVILGIDAVSHGTRGNIAQFLNVEDLRVLRDNFRQTVIDLVQLARFVEEGQLDLDGAPGPDTEGQLYYFGHSMGAILGTVTSTLLPSPPVAVLSAAGGGIGNILETEQLAARIELLIAPALGLGYQDPAYYPSLPLLSAMVQVIVEPADPIAFARRAFAERPAFTTGEPAFLIQQGNGDLTVGNHTTSALAAALGLQQLSATTVAETDAPIQAYWPVDPAAHDFPAEENPHDVFFYVAGLRAQAVTYFATDGRTVEAP